MVLIPAEECGVCHSESPRTAEQMSRFFLPVAFTNLLNVIHKNGEIFWLFSASLLMLEPGGGCGAVALFLAKAV